MSLRPEIYGDDDINNATASAEKFPLRVPWIGQSMYYFPAAQCHAARLQGPRRRKLQLNSKPVWPSGQALVRLVSRRTSVRFGDSALLSPQKLWFVGSVL